MLKLRRHLLPQPDQTAVLVELSAATDDPIGQALAGVAGQHAPLDASRTLAELGIDSLGVVELAASLESKTGKLILEQDLSLNLTVEELRSRVASAPNVDSAEQATRASGPERITTDVPIWPYTWGRALRFISAPFDLLLRRAATRITLLGAQHLDHLPPRVIFAGTHHGFPDMPLVRYALAHSPARKLAGRLISPIAAGGFGSGGIQLGRGLGVYPWIGIVGLGLYPLRQMSDRDVSLRGLARLAQRGNPVVIFPQGTHAHPEEERADSPRVRFRPGVGYLARSLDALVVPFGLAGTEIMMPADPSTFKGLKIAGVPVQLHKGPLAIAFGAPVRIGTDESPSEFAARLQPICYALTREAEAALAPSQGAETSLAR
jgi:1-acyl-sn-glycerol-3-phosphate acyltransferase/acyl carrier protein